MDEARYCFLLLLLTMLATVPARSQASPSTDEAPSRKIAVTIDDLPGVLLPGKGCDPSAWRDFTRRLLGQMQQKNVVSTGFVNESKLCDPPITFAALGARRKQPLLADFSAGTEIHSVAPIAFDTPGGAAQSALSRRFLSRFQSTRHRQRARALRPVDVAPPRTASRGAIALDAGAPTKSSQLSNSSPSHDE